jgi:hypothetical protein
MSRYILSDDVPETADYNKPILPPEECDVYTVKLFREGVARGAFTDIDGTAEAAKVVDGIMTRAGDETIVPTRLNRIPKDATHMCWYYN